MYRKILVTTDGSALSQKASTAAINLARLLGSELLAVTVRHHYVPDYMDGALVRSPEQGKDIEARWQVQAQQVVDVVKAQADAERVPCTALVVTGALVGEAVLDTARKHDCDLIVMASHGRRGLSRLLLGSETQHVLTHSTTPVLVLR